MFGFLVDRLFAGSRRRRMACWAVISLVHGSNCAKLAELIIERINSRAQPARCCRNRVVNCCCIAYKAMCQNFDNRCPLTFLGLLEGKTSWNGKQRHAEDKFICEKGRQLNSAEFCEGNS